MKPVVLTYHEDDEYLTEELCYINELSNSHHDPAVSIAQARLEPGVTTRWHRLKHTTERYCILSGCGLVEIEGLAPTAVNSGDVVIIPPMCAQRVTNIGDDDLLFLAICSPRFEPHSYLDIEPDND